MCVETLRSEHLERVAAVNAKSFNAKLQKMANLVTPFGEHLQVVLIEIGFPTEPLYWCANFGWGVRHLQRMLRVRLARPSMLESSVEGTDLEACQSIEWPVGAT